MTIYKQGDVVLVDYPFTDINSQKKRPALVVSPTSYNSHNPDCVLAAITSTIPYNIGVDCILIKAEEIHQTGLLDESVILIGKVFTIDSSRINKRIGSLNLSLRNKYFSAFLAFYSPFPRTS